MAETGLAEMRSMILDLRPEVIEREGLIRAIEKHVADLKTRYPLNWEITTCTEPELPVQSKTALFRIAQEARYQFKAQRRPKWA